MGAGIGFAKMTPGATIAVNTFFLFVSAFTEQRKQHLERIQTNQFYQITVGHRAARNWIYDKGVPKPMSD